MDIDLESAVRRIRQECAPTPGSEDGRLPFFFIVGAGISAPAIPLASGIEEHCRLKADRHDAPPDLPTPLSRYSYWFREAYPAAAGRQKYLASLIQNKAVTDCNLRLAHILMEHKIASIAVTPNFDDFLTRALTLFGRRHVVCDHPSTAERIDPESVEPQVVHVHGNAQFYDCCNLREEVTTRAASVTVTGLLDSILRYHSPLVLGYSGWADDVIMRALRERLKARLPHNLYWFCYRSEDRSALPQWLLEHEDVYVVLPNSHQADDERNADDRLPARKVLDALLREIPHTSPLITTDPLTFFENHLRQMLEENGGSGSSDDLYGIGAAVSTLEVARTSRSKHRPQRANAGEQLDAAREEIRRANYRRALDIALDLNASDVRLSDVEDLVKIVMTALQAEDIAVETELRAYPILVESLGRLKDTRPEEGTDLALGVVHARFGKALAVSGEHTRAIEMFDGALGRLHGFATAEARSAWIDTEIGKAKSLIMLGRWAEALAAATQITDRYATSDDAPVARAIASAWIIIGAARTALRDSDGAIDAYDQLLTTFRPASDSILLTMRHQAALRQAHLLMESERYEDALVSLDGLNLALSLIIDRATVDDARLALIERATCLAALDDLKGAITALQSSLNLPEPRVTLTRISEKILAQAAFLDAHRFTVAAAEFRQFVKGNLLTITSESSHAASVQLIPSTGPLGPSFANPG